MNHGRVLVAGSLAFDRIFDYPGRFRDDIVAKKLHVLNVSFTVNDVRESFGGTAGNIAFSLRLLGIQASVISSVGDDFDGYRRWLVANGVDVSLLATVQRRKTAAAYIVTDRDDNQITAFQPGAMFEHVLSERALRNAERTAELAILAPGNTVTMVGLAKRFAKRKIPFIFDPGQVIPVLSAADLRLLTRLCSGFISNDYELSLVCQRAHVRPHDLYAKIPFVVTTRGHRGADVVTGGKHVTIRAARPVATVDPTGAGDAFRAGFIAGLIRGVPFVTAARMGAVASVYTVERSGTQTHRYTTAEYVRRFRQNYNDPLPFM